MAEVFLVTAGDYSDYAVLAAFSSREQAEAYAAKRGASSYDGPQVEEFPLDCPEQAWHQTRVDMDRDGVVHNVETTLCLQLIDAPGEPYIDHRGLLGVHVRGEDKTRAIKIANEVRGQWIAQLKAFVPKVHLSYTNPMEGR